jgi:hypothetical protein
LALPKWQRSRNNGIATPANDARLELVVEFAAKTVEALELGIHVLLLEGHR